jgi:imidazoleglycerol-phosphate dehydratase
LKRRCRRRRSASFDSEQLIEDFWQAVAANALCNLHIVLHHGRNSHHIAEADVQGRWPRAADGTWNIDPREDGVPSTKGLL